MQRVEGVINVVVLGKLRGVENGVLKMHGQIPIAITFFHQNNNCLRILNRNRGGVSKVEFKQIKKLDFRIKPPCYKCVDRCLG